MIEIFLFIYCASLALSGLLLAWNLRSLHRQVHSIRFIRLNSNLKKLNLFWSINNERIETLNAESLQDDICSAYRSRWLMGLLGLASLPGFLLFFVLTLSLGLIKNRTFTFLINCQVSKDDSLSAEQIQNVLTEALTL